MAENKYEMNDVQTATNYQVEDDRDIKKAGFSSDTKEERRLKEEVEKYSPKGSIACIILSVIHCHYFYVGRIGRGLLCLFTANFLYIGMIIDWVMILSGRFKDKDGKIVNDGKRAAAEINLREFYKNHARTL